MVKVSIIIPVYNVEEYVAECLESVMAQDAAIPMECIVVDDCGSDNSMTVVKRAIDQYNGPIVFKIVSREKNGGLSAARNSGIEVAQGEYLYFLDSDDTITPNAISLMWRQVEEHPSVELVVGAANCFPTPDMDAFLNLNKFEHPQFSDDPKQIEDFFLNVPEVAWNKLIRADFLRENNLTFKEGILHEDFHQHLRISCHIHSIAFSETVTYNYRMRPGSIMNNSNNILQAFHTLLIVEDLVNNHYLDRKLLKIYLKLLTDSRILIDLNGSYESHKDEVISVLSTIVSHLPFMQSIPFFYLKIPRPWMRVVVLNWLSNKLLK